MTDTPASTGAAEAPKESTQEHRRRRRHGPRPTSAATYREWDADEELPAFLTGQLDRVLAADAEDEVNRELLETLIDLGVPREQAREAILEDRVALLLSRQLLDDAPRYSLQQIADRVEVDIETLQVMRSALGLPQEAGYGELDLEWSAQVAELLEVFSLETAVRSARARGNALNSIVNSDLSVVRDELIIPLRRAGADDVTIGIALAEATKALDPISQQLLLSTYRLQLRHVLSTELAATAVRAETAELRASVGFVDIVGYTRLSSRIDPSGLDQLIDEFERRVVEVTSSRRDVAVVKYLGDAAMLVGPDTTTLVDAMWELVQETESLAESPVRGGLATGDVLARDGDYFGPAVNLAARLTDIARPWKLLVSEDDIDAARTRYEVERVRGIRLRGFGATRPGSVRRPLGEDEVAERQRARREGSAD